MNNKTVSNTFDMLITALETNNYNALDSLFHEDIHFNSSAYGLAENRTDCIKLIREKDIEADQRKIRIFNNVIKTSSDNTAVQSVYTILFLGKMVNGFMHIFQCGFLNMLHYTKLGDEWKITSFNSNMTFECGNSLMVSDKWNLIDYSRFQGNDRHILDQEDNPFHYEDSETEEEKIRNCFYEYCWLIDMNRFESLHKVYKDPFLMKNEKLKDYKDGKEMSVKDSVTIFQKTRNTKNTFGEYTIPKEAIWNHIAHFEKLNINGNNAEALIYRYEPNRIGTRFLHRYNMKTIYYSGQWKIVFQKDHDCWRIHQFEFESGIIEDLNEEDKRYF